MLNFLYSIIIYPLYQIVEVFYTLSYGIVKNPGLAVIGVSLTVSFLCLPLYIIAEKWQELERQTELKLKPGVDRIKAVFKGDEQYMILSTYYKQNHYHPAMGLRSSLSLLIQIPFFIAAYKFLSHLDALKGFSFLFIKDMGNQDALFYIGSFPVNILPIAMTLINISSGIIYSKGHPFKEKVQIYVMAIFFLVFLYSSPSGLVFYWTLNNIFSLLKNVFYKFKKPLKALYICLVTGVLFIDLYLIFIHGGFLYRRLALVAGLMIVPLAPIIIKLINYLLDKPLKTFLENLKDKTILFFLSAITLAILTGLVIPSFLIASSPSEFSFVDEYASPFFFIRNTFFQSLGFFVFWPSCIYFLFNNKVKTIITFLISSLLICGLVNVFIFNGDYGTISTILTFTNGGTIQPSKIFALISFIPVLLIVAGLFIAFQFNKSQYISYISIISFVTLFTVSIYNFAGISKGYKENAIAHEQMTNHSDSISPVFHLSKTEKNVIVIMQDRAISGFIPYIFEENKNLYNQFDGFTYYPNTASYGGMTLVGSPLVYGGYEYTPYEMNRRNNESLVSKHNEALKMMPVLFDQQGFTSTITDLSWCNYSWIPDLRIFDEYPSIRQEPVMRVYNDIWEKEHKDLTFLTSQSTQLKRNLLWFSLFRISSPAIREFIYDEGNWWTAKAGDEFIQDFLNSYSYLYYMSKLTDFTSEKSTFNLLVNETTHEPVNTGYPEFNLTTQEIGPNYLDDDKHYMSLAASLYKWGEFFDYLKENNVYDNTRIIIVADHGGSSKLSEDTENHDLNFVISNFNPLLLVKDFNEHHSLFKNETFMTNGDTPILATKDIVNEPRNPFTNKLLSESVQKDKIYIIADAYWSPDGHNKNTFKLKSEDWYSVSSDVRNPENWKQENPFENKE